MWYGLRAPPKGDPAFVSCATELLQSTSHNLIFTVCGTYLVWHLIATVMWPRELGWNVFLITPVVIVTCALSIQLLPKRPLVAQAVWQIGLAAAITLAIIVFQQPAVGLFYVLLPIMATVTVGWQAGLLAEGSAASNMTTFSG